MHKMYSNRKAIFLMMLPAALLFILFVPIPTIALLYGSLCDWEVFSGMTFNGLNNYKFLFTQDMDFWPAVKNNITWLCGGLLLQIVPAFFLSLILSRPIRGQKLFRNISFLPVALSGTAVSLIWYFIYHGEIGVVNQIVRLFGYADFDKAWLMDPDIALFCVLLAVAWQWTGYYMVMMLSGIAQIPEEVIESAKLDGANSFQVVRFIVIPYLQPIFKVTIMLATISSFKGFDLMYVMTKGGPNHATDLLALQMYEKSFTSGLYGYGSAMAVIIMMLCIGASVVINHLFRKSVED